MVQRAAERNFPGSAVRLWVPSWDLIDFSTDLRFLSLSNSLSRSLPPTSVSHHLSSFLSCVSLIYLYIFISYLHLSIQLHYHGLSSIIYLSVFLNIYLSIICLCINSLYIIYLIYHLSVYISIIYHLFIYLSSPHPMLFRQNTNLG